MADDTRTDRDALADGEPGRQITYDLMRHYGYADQEIEAAESHRCDDECEEHEVTISDGFDDLNTAAAAVMFTLDHPAALAAARADGAAEVRAAVEALCREAERIAGSHWGWVTTSSLRAAVGGFCDYDHPHPEHPCGTRHAVDQQSERPDDE